MIQPEPQDSFAIEATWTRTWAQRLADRVFGFDFFISYAWKDGRGYAVALAEELKRQGYDCFLDSESYAAGDDWRKIGAWALRKTTRLVLVGTPAALESKPVLRELAVYTAMGGRIIPIEAGAGLDRLPAEHPAAPYLPDGILRILEDPARWQRGPSAATQARLVQCFAGERQSAKRLRWVRRLAGVLALLTLATAAAAVFAIQKRTEAWARQLAATAELVRAEGPTKTHLAAALAVESLRLGPTHEAEITLRRSLASWNEVWRVKFDGVTTAITCAPDGGSAAVVSIAVEQTAGATLRRVDLKSGVARWAVAVPRQTEMRWMSAGGENWVTAESDGTTQPHLVLRDGNDGAVRPWPSTMATSVDLRVAPDGKTAIVIERNGQLTLVETEGWAVRVAQAGMLPGPVTFSDDGGRVVVGEAGRGAVVRETATGRNVSSHPTAGAVSVAALNRDGTALALGDTTGRVTAWAALEGAPFEILLGGAVRALAFSPDGKMLAAALPRGVVALVELRNKRVTAQWQAPQGTEVRSRREAPELQFSRDSRWLALRDGNGDDSIVWQVGTGKAVSHPGAGRQPIIFVGQGGLIVAPDQKEGVTLWDLLTDQPVAQFTDVDSVMSYALNESRGLLVTGGGDGSLAVWRAELGQPGEAYELKEPVAEMAQSPDGRFLAIADFSGGAMYVDRTQPERRREFATGWLPEAIAVSPDGRWVAISRINRLPVRGRAAPPTGITLWDAQSGQSVFHPGEFTSAAFTPDAASLVVTTANAVEVRRIPDWSVMATHVAEAGVARMRVSADGQWVAGTIRGTRLRRWSLAAWDAGPELKLTTEPDALYLSTNGRWAAIHDAASVWVIDLMDATAKQHGPFNHTQLPGPLAVSSDGSSLATALANDVIVRDLHLGTTQPIPGAGGYLLGLAFDNRRGGGLFASGGARLEYHDLEAHALTQSAQARLPRTPTAVEWTNLAPGVPYPSWMNR